MINLKSPVSLKSLSVSDARWVQQRLVDGGYLDSRDVDGIVGPKTLAAFNAWKLDSFQNQLGVIGPGSVMLLAQLERPDPVGEQPANLAQKPNAQAGNRTGASATLPLVGQVWANQWVDPEFPYFTWGEMTAGLTRLPKTSELVKNGLALVRTLGIIRKRHGVAWIVTSAYRTPEVNRRIGGASRSTHLSFRGADVSPVNRDFARVVAIARATPQIRGIGFGQKRGFIHLDIGWDDNTKRREFGY
ncbi:MAG: D-Ala-D-Ala carboxypeptidase family metallohydrolase [Cyanobacteriota bacterium]